MKKKNLGLYIHWPYCESKCPYCDFNSFVAKSVDVDAFAKAYAKELLRYHQLTANHQLVSIFFGGGTPSLMPPTLTKAIIAQAFSLWSHNEGIEITLEANPSSVEAGKFSEFRKAGVNRLSLGIQSFHDEALKFLGRPHNAEEGKAAINLAKSIFPRVSFDLIYARPGQTLLAWEDELKTALDFNTDHLSLYQLTIEPGTAFAPRYAREEIVLPEEELAADMFELTNELCESAGLQRYETSNHARSGFESQHNLIYWRYDDYVGIGPGAHGRFLQGEEKLATEQHRAPDIWLKKVLEEGDGNVRTHRIGLHDQAKEALMMGLRLSEGVGLKRHTLPYNEVTSKKAIDELQHAGLITLEKDTLKLTGQGHLCLNAVLKHLLS